MSITPISVLPASVLCIGVILFFLGWRTLGLVLMIAPVALGLLVLLWALLSADKET